MEIIFAPIQPFIMHPGRIAMMAGFLFIVFLFLDAVQRRAWPTLNACIGWILFAIWEAYCKKTGANIRIDLVVIIPVIYSLTLFGLIAGFQRRNSEPTDGDNS